MVGGQCFFSFVLMSPFVCKFDFPRANSLQECRSFIKVSTHPALLPTFCNTFQSLNSSWGLEHIDKGRAPQEYNLTKSSKIYYFQSLLLKSQSIAQWKKYIQGCFMLSSFSLFFLVSVHVTCEQTNNRFVNK